MKGTARIKQIHEGNTSKQHIDEPTILQKREEDSIFI